MAKILLDYFFKIIAINPTPAASTAFLKQVCFVGKPDGDTEGDITLCTSVAQAQALLDTAIAKAEVAELFSAGLSRVYVLTAAALDLAEYLEPEIQNFFTILISSDYDDGDIGETEAVEAVAASIKIQDITYTAVVPGADGNDISIDYDNGGTAGAEEVTIFGNAISIAIENGVSTAAQIAAAIEAHVGASAMVTVEVDVGDESDPQSSFGPPATNLEGGADATGAAIAALQVGEFNGVIGVCSVDNDFLEAQAVIENRCAFKTKSGNGAKNMCYAFGKLLANTSDWTNQQYIQMPFDDDIDLLGDAEFLFDEKISFVIDDDEFGSRLALFSCGGKAIVAPYILRNLEIDLQSKGLQYVSANQPGYTFTQAALIEDELQKVIDGDGLENGDPGYVGRGWITEGSVNITLEEDNFLASGNINVPTPRALWRISGTITQS